MPVARIITRTPDEVDSLAEQLRARGFTVEITTPDQDGLTPAEVELFVESHPWREVMQRANEAAARADADVFVASGIYDVPRPVEHAPSHHLVLESEILAPPETLPQWREPEVAAEGNVIQNVAHSDVSQPRNRGARAGALAFEAGARLRTLFEWGVAKVQEHGLRLWRSLKVRRHRGVATVAEVASSDPSLLRDARVAFSGAMRDLAGHTAAMAKAVVGSFTAAVRSPNARLARKSGGRHQPGPTPKPLRPEAAAPPRPAPVHLASSLFAAVPEPVDPVLPKHLPIIRRTREREHEWKLGAVFSLTIAIAITVAWAMANRHPAAPLPTSVLMKSGEMQQQVPFGPVTLPAPGSAGRRVPSSLPAKPVMQKVPARTAPARRARNYEDDEVVVRHFRTRPAVVAVPVRDGIKRISDLQ